MAVVLVPIQNQADYRITNGYDFGPRLNHRSVNGRQYHSYDQMPTKINSRIAHIPLKAHQDQTEARKPRSCHDSERSHSGTSWYMKKPNGNKTLLSGGTQSSRQLYVSNTTAVQRGHEQSSKMLYRWIRTNERSASGNTPVP